MKTLLVYSNWMEASPSSPPAIFGADAGCFEVGLSEAMHTNARKLVEAIRCAANGVSEAVDTSDSSSTISASASLGTPEVAREFAVAPLPHEQLGAAIAAESSRVARLAAAAAEASAAKRREFELAEDIRMSLEKMPVLLKSRLALLVGQDGGLEVPTAEDLAKMMGSAEPVSEAGWLAWGTSVFASAGEDGAAVAADPQPSLLTVPSAGVEDLELEFQTESWARTCSVDMFGDEVPAVDAAELDRASAAVRAAVSAKVMDEAEYARRAKAMQHQQQPLGGEKLMAALLGEATRSVDQSAFAPVSAPKATADKPSAEGQASASSRVCSADVCPVM